MSKKPEDSTSSEAPSPLDRVRDRALAATKKPVKWDIEEDDPVIRRQILQFVLNLVEQTPPNSKLAYKLCHFMEADHLSLPDLVKVFPTGRAAYKKAHKAYAEEKKNLRDQLMLARAEIRNLRAGVRAAPKGSAPELEAAIEAQKVAMAEFERDIATLEKGNEDYKESYPLMDTTKSRGSAVKEEDWEALRSYLRKAVAKPIKGQESNYVKNTELLCNHLGFSEAEKMVLLIILIADDDDGFNDLLRGLGGDRQKNAHTVMARMAGLSREVVSDMLRSNAPLSEKGIFAPASELATENDDGSEEDGPVFPQISRHLAKVLKEPDLTIESMMKQFVGEPATTHLDWDRDFAYLGEQGAEMIRMLQGGIAKGAAGINVLLYGIPGTGKTEAIKAAAKKLGLELYVIGERTKFGKHPKREDRISAAILAQELLADKKNAAIFLDEMEDIFPQQVSLADMFGGAASGDNEDQQTMGENDSGGTSKVFLNRLLERNRTPTFWAANRPDKFDPAFRRRVIFSMELRVPPADVRQKIWTSVAARHDFTLSAEESQALARNFVVAPGLMENAIRHSALSGGGIKAIQGSLRAASSLLFQNRRAIDAREALPAHYDMRFLNATVQASDFDIRTLGENIKASGRRDFSLLLQGPPGTGKTQYLSYLANLLEMDVMLKDASSLTSKFVGETEKRISAAFSEAEERGMFLVINEGDTFVRRRDELGQNHEISAVNIMLTCMERHTQPFGFTTNLGQNIDPAAKRRFLFKVALDYLTAEQSVAAFEHFFKKQCSVSDMRQLPRLVPADFVNVKKQIEFMSGEMPESRLLRLLALEAKERADSYNAQLYSGRDGGYGFAAQQRMG